jgi:uncharacterized damage-inducible protein DinB
MKQIFLSYSAYNLWANRILSDRAGQLSGEILHKDMNSSFGSIYGTFVHLMEVENIWWQRLRLQERVQSPQQDPEEDFKELSSKLLSLSLQWNTWVTEAGDMHFTHVFGYQNSKKEFFKQPVYEMLLHLFNHQTYHRGQIVTMMRQNGTTRIPGTDFISFSRKK